MNFTRYLELAGSRQLAVKLDALVEVSVRYVTDVVLLVVELLSDNSRHHISIIIIISSSRDQQGSSHSFSLAIKLRKFCVSRLDKRYQVAGVADESGFYLYLYQQNAQLFAPHISRCVEQAAFFHP